MDDYAQKLKAAVAMKREAEALVHQLAYDAHQNGMLWAEVAEITGVSRQTASASFRLPPVREPNNTGKRLMFFSD